MKIRIPLLIRVLSWLLYRVVRLWIGSLRVTRRAHVPAADPLDHACDGQFLYATWHETILLAIHVYRQLRAITLISRSADGELIAQVIGRLGWQVVRGSSSKGAVAASREILRLAQVAGHKHVALAVDGPRGPRRTIKDGLISLAERTGLSIVPTGFAFERPWRAKSWDRMVLPRPFSRACIVYGTPIAVPVGSTAGEKAKIKIEVEEAMLRLETESHAHLGIAQPLVSQYRAASSATLDPNDEEDERVAA